MKVPTWEESAIKSGMTPLEFFVYSWEPDSNYDKKFSEDLQKLVDWLLTQCRCDERED